MILRLLALTLLACLAARQAVAADKLTLVLDWFVNPDHAPLIIAQEKGFFGEAGLAVALVAPADPNDPPKLVAAGKAELAISYEPQVHIHVGEGLPLVRIATLIDTPLNSVVALADGPVKSLADLKGRKVGFSVGGFEDALLGAMLARHGLKTGDVQLINVNFTLTPALVSGQVDAVLGAFRNFEINQIELAGKKGRAFFVEEEGVPMYDELVVVAHKDKLADPRFPRFVDAVERGTAYLLNHPEESWTLFVKGRKEVDDELNKRAWRDTLPRFAHSPAALDRGRWLRFAAFLRTHGVTKTAPALDTYAVELTR